MLTRATLETIARDRKNRLDEEYLEILTIDTSRDKEHYYYDVRDSFIRGGLIDSKYSVKELKEIWDDA